MRQEILLIRTAIGNVDPGSIKRKKSEDVGRFKIYDVELPQRQFRGLPPRWTFAILTQPSAPTGEQQARRVLDDAETLIEKDRLNSMLLLLSDDPNVHLYDNLQDDLSDVFFLDHAELPSARKVSASPRLSPLMRSVRRQITQHDLPALFGHLNPYIRNRPVSGWRFFGRKAAIDQLLGRPENFVVVGARRIGKTSLLSEVEHRLTERGESVYYVDVQNYSTQKDVVSAILRTLSPKDLHLAIRHKRELNEPLIESVIKKITAGHKSATLILDELGNVLDKLPDHEWRFLGALRKFSQKGRLRVIFSCFQQYFLRMQREFEGPLVNYASTLRLGTFPEAEVRDAFLYPLELWRPLQNRTELHDLVLRVVGRHPFLLQHFCAALFERVARRSGGQDLLKEARMLLSRDLRSCFKDPVEELFYELPSPTLKYLFLARCQEAKETGEPLYQAELNDDWVQNALARVGYQSDSFTRRNLLVGLEVRGLTSSVEDDYGRQAIAMPVVFHFIAQVEREVGCLIAKFADEIRFDTEQWGLVRQREAVHV